MNVKIKRIGTLLPCALASVLFCSCADSDLLDGDFGFEGDVKSLTLPIAHGKMSLWDILDTEDNDYLVTNRDTLVIVYSEPNVVSDMKVDDFFDMQTQDVNFTTSPIVVPGTAGVALPFDITVSDDWSSSPIVFPQGVSIDELLFSSELKISIPATSFNYKLTLAFNNLKKEDNTPFNVVINGVAGQDATQSYTDNLIADLDANDKISVNVTLSVNAGEVIDGNVAVSIALGSVDYIRAVGQLGDGITANIDQSSFSLESIEFLNEISGKFSFAKPEILLTVNNTGIGVPFETSLLMSATNGDKSAELKLNGDNKFYVPGNGSVENSQYTNLFFNAQNSTIVDFFSLPPTGVVLCSGEISTKEEPGRNDTIWKDASLGLDVAIRVPLMLSAEGLVYNDTIKDLGLSGDIEKCKSGSLKFVVQNEIPLNLKISSLKLYDEFGNTKEILTPTGDGSLLSGEKGSPVKSSIDFVLDEESIHNLADTENIGIEVVVSTDGTKTIMSTQSLEFSLVVSAIANMSELTD